MILLSIAWPVAAVGLMFLIFGIAVFVLSPYVARLQTPLPSRPADADPSYDDWYEHQLRERTDKARWFRRLSGIFFLAALYFCARSVM